MWQARPCVLAHVHSAVAWPFHCDMAILLTPVHLLVILLHSRPLVVLSDSRILCPLRFLDSRPSCRPLAVSQCPLPLFSLVHCHPPYQLHIQLSTAVQKVFPIHSCFNSRSLSVGYCCLLVATVTTASVSLACFCHIITEGGNTALHCFLIEVPSKVQTHW